MKDCDKQGAHECDNELCDYRFLMHELEKVRKALVSEADCLVAMMAQIDMMHVFGTTIPRPTHLSFAQHALEQSRQSIGNIASVVIEARRAINKRVAEQANVKYGKFGKPEAN